MRKAEDLTNQIFGKWTVLYRSQKHNANNGIAYWVCQCACGMIRDIAGTDLKHGKTTQCKQCALKNNQKISAQRRTLDKEQAEIGKRYGQLSVIAFVNQTAGGSMWKCRCDCGNEITVRIDNLHSGRTKSCGCIKSQGELIIHKTLKENCINYISEYSFNDLIGVNGGKLRFDFAIFDCNNQLIKLIEFQGRQHYDDCPNNWNDVRFHDQLKREYCIKNNIQLLEIPYYDIDKININYLLQ